MAGNKSNQQESLLGYRNETERNDSVGKVLIASFDREEEQDFEELILFLKEKGYGEFISMASTDNVLKYDGIEINPQYRAVREQGIEIELTNYEFEILYLLARHPGQVFSKE